MTRNEAITAMENRTKVQAGDTVDDHDTGYIRSIDGDMAIVGWDTGVATPCLITDLTRA